MKRVLLHTQQGDQGISTAINVLLPFVGGKLSIIQKCKKCQPIDCQGIWFDRSGKKAGPLKNCAGFIG